MTRNLFSRVFYAMAKRGASAEESSAASTPKRSRIESRKKKGFDEEIYSETSYYIENGLRKVRPYYFTFVTHAKGRWFGSTIYDVFCKEFRAETPEYYKKAIELGLIKVNDHVTNMDAVLTHHDVISHLVHRHEPPVCADPIEVIEANDDVVIVNKPSSIPVHPCGRYRHNTVIFLLGKEHGFTNLRTVHRIDRLTSGILIFARSLTAARTLESQIRSREVQKEYVCRVDGEFPTVRVECNEPIATVSHKIGVCFVSSEGKACRTEFERLSYDGTTSVVKCTPHTGRMHQIRVHLQWLGYPIANDPIYNHKAWGPKRGKGGEGICSVEEIVGQLLVDEFGDDDGNAQLRSVKNSYRPLPTKKNASDGDDVKNDKDKIEAVDEKKSETITAPEDQTFWDPNCSECSFQRPDPKPRDLVMYLHALKYKGLDWEYATEIPKWAKEGWTQ
ncbi:pseudouridylate synthase RPUSD2-like [Oscarella lobularis]|uniref:pseudouridylate synthase RPUSD2-like n=1 Tax=Oscarella lobularis TaxID=121494 RepID=UPI0033136D57